MDTQQKVSKRIKALPVVTPLKFREVSAKNKDVIHLEVADPYFGSSLPEHIVEAAKKAVDKQSHYSDHRGVFELREAIAEIYKKEDGIAYDPESEILVTVGASEANFNAILSTIDHGDEVIVADPSYICFYSIVKLAGGTLVPISLHEEKEWKLNVKELESKVTSRTKMIILNSPNNPTGTVYTEEELAAVAKIAKRHDLLVLYDHIFDKIVFDGYRNYNIAALPGMKERTILTYGLSKVYGMCGYRIGWLAANEDIIENIASKLHIYVSQGPPYSSQMAAVAALKGSQEFLDEWVRSYQRRRDIVIEGINEIDGLSCVKPRGGYFAFINHSRLEKSSYKFSEFLLKEAKIAVAPGLDWGVFQGEGHIRLVFGSETEERIIDALGRIKKCIKTYKL